MSAKARWAVILVGALLFVSVFVWRTADADATPPKGTQQDTCMDRNEYGHIELGMPANEARELLDGNGVGVVGHPYLRAYDLCGHPLADIAYGLVWYKNKRVVKAAVLIAHETTPERFRLAG